MNPLSGTGRMRSALENAFQAAGLRPRVVLVSNARAIREAAREAVESGETAVVAAGGDGTVSAVASVLAGTPVALGVLPLGTLNHFAKDLGIPLETEAAVRTLAAGRTAAVDAGEVNGRVFVNNSSIGLYPALVMQRELRRRLGFGWLRSLVSGAAAVLRWHPYLHLRIEVNGSVRKQVTPFVFVGNNRYVLNGLSFGSRARMDEGVLSVYMVTGSGRLEMVRMAALAVAGRLRQARGFEETLARNLRIQSHRKRLLVAIDGEAIGVETPLEYRIRPGALRVLVP